MQQEYKGWAIQKVECDEYCDSAMENLGLGLRNNCCQATGFGYKAFPPYEIDKQSFLAIWQEKILPDIKDWPSAYVCGGSMERVYQLIDVFEDALIEKRNDLTTIFQN